MPTNTIRLHRVLQATPERIYRAFLDPDAEKLKCLIQTAETVVQFLALVVLAQLHHDLEHR